MTELLLLVLVVAIALLWLRLHRLEARVRALEGSAPARSAFAAPVPPLEQAAPPPPRRAPRAIPRPTIESLVGGRLPIWIGGIALVLAGFFLVRYSIERGLLGPLSRTLLAAGFAALLIAASEAARRLPAIAADPRVGQVLAGAGIAVFYVALYLAAALYHLVMPLAGFTLMLGVTALALVLSLRQGAPTAVMALAGGFAAPMLAGFDAAGVAPLLVYLGLLTATLFSLAARRGWPWLALLAAAAGFAWINFLLLALPGTQLAGVGAFAVLLAAGASAALPATGAQSRWLRLAPLVAGCVQLVALAPALDFGALAWSFYCVLAAVSLILAWRDPRFLPGSAAALALLLLLEALALLQPERSATPLAAIAATLLFALPGHLLARRSPGWAALALGGTAGPLLVAMACATPLLTDTAWAALATLAAAATASLAWRARTRPGAILTAASATTALLLAIAALQLLPWRDAALPAALLMLALAVWARFTRAPGLFALPVWPLILAVAAAAPLLSEFARMIVASLTGDTLPYRQLPALSRTLTALAPPAIAAALLLRDPRQFGPHRWRVGFFTAALGLLLLYTLAKQPLAIATPAAFLARGFVERAAISQLLLATGTLLVVRTALQRLGWALVTIALFRIAWFDIVLFCPILVPQQSWYLAPVHAALLAFWLWQLPRLRTLALAATALALVVLVRQLTHGTLLTGPVTTLENSGYSAALLVLALAWLRRGIVGGGNGLRLAGLSLLTLVTLKVFLIDAAALDGVLRILSFLGLGLALIGIGWAYGRFLGRTPPEPAQPSP